MGEEQLVTDDVKTEHTETKKKGVEGICLLLPCVLLNA